MSEGPIKAARQAWSPPKVTTNPAEAVHAVRAAGDPRPYCGTRRGKVTTSEGALVTCSACTAAIAADLEEGSTT